MHMRDTLDVLRRRWYLVLLAVLISIGLVSLLATRLEPAYRATASVVLVPPDSTVGEAGNPYLFLGGLSQSVDVLSRSVNSETTRNKVEDLAPSGHYETVADATTSAPILVVTTEDSSGDGAMNLLAAVLAQVPTSLSELQDQVGVASNARITSQVVTASDEPEVAQKARVRSLAMVGIAALGVGLLITGLVDGLLARRGRVRSGRA